jgi:hypothetical protein
MTCAVFIDACRRISTPVLVSEAKHFIAASKNALPRMSQGKENSSRLRSTALCPIMRKPAVHTVSCIYPRCCRKPSMCRCLRSLIEAINPSTSTSRITSNYTLPLQYYFRIDFPKLHRPTRLNRDVRLERPSSSVAADARPWTRRLCSSQEPSLGHVATASSEALVIAPALCLLFKLARPPTCADTTWQHVWW